MKHLYYSALYILLLTVFSCKKSEVNISDGFPDNGRDSASITVDTSTTRVDASKFSEARIYPGLVCAEEPRITQTLNMNLDYQLVTTSLRISVPPYPQFSTGFYAAPGELITIDVPANMYSLTVQIGAWTDNLTGKQAQGTALKRAPIIFMKQQLAPGRNYVRNLYGGHVYILTNVPQKNPVTLTFGNVCKSPDFVLGETNAAAWQAAIRSSCVPHLELRSRNFAIVVPREYCIQRPITDPDEMLREWDLGMDEDFYKWTGLVDNPADPIDATPRLPVRFVLDVDPVVGYGHSGFPIVAYQDLYWFTSFADVSRIKTADVWGVYHEIGHNFQQGWWSWSSLGETTNNLFIYKLANRMLRRGITAAWPPRENYRASQATQAIAFANDAAAGKNFNGTDTRINDPFLRLTPFLQIFDKVPANWDGNGMPDGWGFFPYLYSQTRRALRQPGTDLAKQDFFFETLSDYTKKNWILFFNKWGIQISDVTLSRVLGKGYPIMNNDFWNYNPITRTGGNATVNVDPYAKSAWAIRSFSSQQASGEGAFPTGSAVAIIDGSISTYWHSAWSPQANFPHWIIVDFNNFLRADNALPIKGFTFVQRQNAPARHIRNIRIEYSNNATTWTAVPGSPFVLQTGVNTPTTINLANTLNARYIRLWVNGQADVTATDGPWACLAEFDVIKP